MEFYNEGVKYAKVPDFFWYRNGAFLDRLVAVNTLQSQKEFKLQPIYQALLTFKRDGNVTFIDIGWSAPWVTIILFDKFPFVSFLKSTKVTIEDA